VRKKHENEVDRTATDRTLNAQRDRRCVTDAEGISIYEARAVDHSSSLLPARFATTAADGVGHNSEPSLLSTTPRSLFLVKARSS
jgi:hypothetical protein